MAWYTDIDSIEKYKAFTKWLNANKEFEGCGFRDSIGDPKSYSGLIQFWAWTYSVNDQQVPNNHIMWTWQSDKGVVQNRRNARLAEMVLSYCKGVLKGKSPTAGAFLRVVSTLTNRDGPQFEAAANKAIHGGVNMNQLAQELTGLRQWVSGTLQTLWDHVKDGQDEQELESAMAGDIHNGLTKLRDHQKMKLDGTGKGLFSKGGHRKGNFMMITRAKDHQPLLIVSSGLGESLSQKWIDRARLLQSDRLSNVSVGVWSQDQDKRYIYFGPREGKQWATVDRLRQALHLCGVLREQVWLRAAEQIDPSQSRFLALESDF